MKSLFLFALPLFLAGCFHHTWNDKPTTTPKEEVAPGTSEEATIPMIIALGTDGKVNWSCKLEELNDSLVWVKCDFHNSKTVPESACTKVGFFNNQTNKLVVESRKVCSGPLAVGATSTNYAAFIKENRVALRACGELLDLCVMLAGPADEM